MPSPPRDFLTVDQIADRWGLDRVDVHQLVLTMRLPQAFLVCGPARVVRAAAEAGECLSHALTAQRAAWTRLLTSTLRRANELRAWPLTEVLAVYEFIVEGHNDTGRLLQLCNDERVEPTGWTIEFDPDETEVVGRDLFKLASDALRDQGLVPMSALVQFEDAQHIALEGHEQPSSQKHLRDRLKQRCRVAAEILWERDRTATVGDLYRSDWVRRVACHGNPPTEKTFREWVKDLNPDRSPGRRSR